MSAMLNEADTGGQTVMFLSPESIYVHFVSNQGQRLIDVSEVVEIIPMVLIDAAQQSGSDPGFAGLINYRGRIIPVFDINAGEPCCQPDIDHFLIVTATAVNSIAIVAMEVTQLVSIPDADISAISPANSDHFRVAKVGESMVRIVRTDDFIRVAP